MSAIQTVDRDDRPIARDTTDERRRAVTALLALSAFSECTCPGDCERDHDNE